MSAPNVGEFLDRRYRVIRPLAMGGFGQTYIAEDTRLPGSPKCVVKYLKPSNTDPAILQNARRLFRTEAETLLQLGKYDQIPQLLAFFEEDQDFYLVQELVEGNTLSTELLPGQRWAEGKVFGLLQEVLGIIEVIHGHGIIHRDIKPDNIVRRSRDSKLVLVDFGTVKQVRSHYSVIGSSMATIATGTPGYMPTEQGQGRPRPNSDIYALGIIAVQALTGLYPSQLAEDAETGEVLWFPWAQCGDGLTQILTRMVRYHFKDRYQTASEALTDLGRFAGSTLTLLEDTSANTTVVSVNEVHVPPKPPKSTVVSVKPLTSPTSEERSSIPFSSKPTIVSSSSSLSHPVVLPESTAQLSNSLETVTSLETVISKDTENNTLSGQEVLDDIQSTSSTHISLDGLENIAQPSLSLLTQPVRPILPRLTYSHLRTSIPAKTMVGAGVLVILSSVVGLGMIYFFKSTSVPGNPDLSLLPCSSELLPPKLPNRSPDKTYQKESGIIKYYGKLKLYHDDQYYAADGKGIMIFEDGSQYYGGFEKTALHGCGTLIHANKRTYVGQFEYGVKSGQGVWTLENKDKYVGNFKDGDCDGYGEFFFADGRSPHKGVWKNNKSIDNKNLSCAP